MCRWKLLKRITFQINSYFVVGNCIIYLMFLIGVFNWTLSIYKHSIHSRVNIFSNDIHTYESTFPFKICTLKCSLFKWVWILVSSVQTFTEALICNFPGFPICWWAWRSLSSQMETWIQEHEAKQGRSEPVPCNHDPQNNNIPRLECLRGIIITIIIFFNYLPSSGISSYVRTDWAVTCLHTWCSPAV